MRRVRLDEEDLIVLLRPGLEEQGYIQDGHEILGFEFRTRRIRRGGDYYRDGVKDGEYPPEGVEEVRWIKVLVGPRKRRPKEETDEVAGTEVDDGSGGEDADGEVPAEGGIEA